MPCNWNEPQLRTSCRIASELAKLFGAAMPDLRRRSARVRRSRTRCASGTSAFTRSIGNCSIAAPRPSPGTPWKKLAKAAAACRACSPARRTAPIAERFAEAVGQGAAWRISDRERVFAPFTALRDELGSPVSRAASSSGRANRPQGRPGRRRNGRVLQVPGWSNIFTQPIINRIEMLSTGVRTDIGVKVFGPDLDTIDRVCKDIEAALKPINGARDVIAAPIMGKGYLQIDIDREKAARYGISVEDIQNEIEVALAGRAVTYTVEKRDRFPVRIRYARADREDEESIRRLLVSPGSMAASTGGWQRCRLPGSPAAEMPATPAASGSEQSHAATPAHAGRGKPLIPLERRWPTCRIVEGPAMIKSENGRLAELRHAERPRPRHRRLRRRSPARRRPEGSSCPKACTSNGAASSSIRCARPARCGSCFPA